MNQSSHKSPIPREKIWALGYEPGDAERDEAVNTLAASLEVSPLVARLLYNRGYRTPAEAELFLHCDPRVLCDPFAMQDMEPAVARVLRAVEAGEYIVIWGDYDVDGVTSVTSLYLYLSSLGADVSCYIPNRIGEGYGMSRAAVDKLAQDGAKLIITVDTGITAADEIAYAASLGVDTVVTDHHECHGELPVCCAIVNPHRPDCAYPFKELAGVGVVFKFLCASEARRAGVSLEEAFETVAAQYIDLVAIGTIADVMPLVGENRLIVARGLAMLEHSGRPGLCALMDAMSNTGNARPAVGDGAHPPKKPRRRVNSGLVGFGIAPRINAAGRIAHAMQAVNLLLAETPEEAAELAEALCTINARRQSEENDIAEQAYAMIESRLAEAEANGEAPPRILVLEHDGWLQGIVGIVASRVTERYGLPSILISLEQSILPDGPDPDDLGKGSGRSVKGLNLVEALDACSDLLVRFGGHELAAGLTVRRGDIPALRARLEAYAAERLTDEMTAVRYEADCVVEAAELTMDAAISGESLEPYGVGNPTPHFVLNNATVQRIVPMGAGRHVKLTLGKDGRLFTGVWFGMSPARLPAVVGDEVDVLFQLNINEYQGVRSLQLILQDLRPSAGARAERMHMKERLDAILAGAPLLPEECPVPDRADIAAVFTRLRTEARRDVQSITERDLLDRLQHAADGNPPWNGVKLRLVLHILKDMGVIACEEIDDGIFRFTVHFDAPKTSIEASPLLMSLRRRAEEVGSR